MSPRLSLPFLHHVVPGPAAMSRTSRSAFAANEGDRAKTMNKETKTSLIRRSWLGRLQRIAGGFALCVLCSGMALAQSAGPDVTKSLDDLKKAVQSAQMSGDNAWMLTSAALVLMMTGPGLALFYGGLVRRKNVLGTMMHS